VILRLSHLLFLAVGIAVGLAIGMTVTRDRSRAPRGTHQATPPRTKGTPAAPAPQAERTRPESPSAPPRVRRTDTPTAGSAALPEGMGILELLWTGAPEETSAWLSGTDFVGEPETIDLDRRDPSAAITQTKLIAGEYVISLEVDGELSPRSWPVTIRPGSITSLDLGAPPSLDRYPIPAGLGRLDFTVHDLDGAPFHRAAVRIVGKALRGKQIEDFAQANTAGKGRFHLKPGTYEIQLGSQQRRVVIRAGETLEQIFRYQDEGEIHFDESTFEGELSLAPDASGVWKRPPYEWLGVPDRFYYVRPGTYRLMLETRHRQKPLALGRVEVRRGRVVTVDYLQPKGAIQISIHCPVGRTWTDEFPIVVTPVSADPARPPERFGCYKTLVTPQNAAAVQAAWTTANHLPPGRYRVGFDAKGWESVETEVEVGETLVKVLLETRPLPK